MLDIRTQTMPKLSVFLLILGFSYSQRFSAYYNNTSIKDVLLKHGIGFLQLVLLLLFSMLQVKRIVEEMLLMVGLDYYLVGILS